MKYTVTLLLIVMTGIVYVSCNQKKESGYQDSNPDYIQVQNPFQISISSYNLIDTYKDLINNTNVHITANSNKITFNVWSSMPAKGYNSSGKHGILSFDTFYQNDSTFFHTILDSFASAYRYYGAYIPDNIVFPFTGPNVANDIFQARFISIVDYKNAPGIKDYSSLNGKYEIKVQDIYDIVQIYLETTKGYINKTEPANYKNQNSSKGIVCVLHMKNETYVPCYLINNYDGAGTFIWKTINK